MAITTTDIRNNITNLSTFRNGDGTVNSDVLAGILTFIADNSGTTTPTVTTLSTFTTSNLTNTATAIISGSTSLYGFYIDNPNTIDCYLKIYNNSAPTIGTTPTVRKFRVPANGFIYIQPVDLPIHRLTTGLAVAVTTGLADSNTTAPTTNLYGVFDYA